MAKLELYAQVEVSFPDNQYSINICRNGLTDPGMLKHLVPGKQVLIVTNQTIAPHYMHHLQNAYADLQCDAVILPDGEEYKNQYSLHTIYDALIQKRHHRDTTLIALGGGVVGDITGFAASTFQRGARYIQIPTTLLAQVDASVGGKTAINHPLGKNLIGSFYQPQAVLIDLNTLNTLPEREFRAGLAEIIKYGLLTGGDFLSQLRDELRQGINAQSAQLPNLIAQCCSIKAQYVISDEKEHGARALLNLGHTFAHALEAYTHYKRWLHGEAVAIGLFCAAVLSGIIGLLDTSVINDIEQMLSDAGLPHKIPADINLNELRDLMSLDKKIKNNCLRFVVIRTPGDCYLDSKVTEDCLFQALNKAVEGE
ncbi:MAG: 3-dehydroquinate synthase [Legionella sp.]|nr:3-dehydroquinate synthase [Legionella sp.]